MPGTGHIEGARIPAQAGAALVPHRLVKFSSGSVVYNTAAAEDEPVGVNEYQVAQGGGVSIRLLCDPGTIEVAAAGEVAAGAKVYAAADGKVQALPALAGTYRRIGTALTPAAANGEVIEVLPLESGALEVVS